MLSIVDEAPVASTSIRYRRWTLPVGGGEGEVIASRSQQATKEALDAMRRRAPFRFREIHPDNDSGLINAVVWQYCRKAKIRMSRSRPYQKNDNAWVEQRNWTHVRKLVGYRRLDTMAELALMRKLYETGDAVQELLPAHDEAGVESAARRQDSPPLR